MSYRVLYIFPLLLLALLNSCDETRIFEKDIDLKSFQWSLEDSLKFEVSIENEQPKNVYLNFRHSFDFGWRNAWVNIVIQFPNDSIYALPVNISLSQPDGQWYGKCTGSICDMQFPIDKLANYTFSQKGDYTISLVHEMRENPLLEVLSVGIRIENAVSQE